MGPFERVILIVLDSVGCGGAPDVSDFGDDGSDTLGNIHNAVGLHLPNLSKLGLSRITEGIGPSDHVVGAWGRMHEVSAGKDTTTGHWELSGTIRKKDWPYYPNGFPEDVMDPFEEVVGKPALGNEAASGTEIIERLGKAHLESGCPIVYTSADSVFQIACHTDVVAVEKLYEWCEAARQIMVGPHEVARVIARPFGGEPGSFVRDQAHRKDFSILPPAGALPLLMKEAGLEVWGVGKIYDIFAGVGITEKLKTATNDEGINRTLEAMEKAGRGLIFTNLVDFDTMYGHRNNPEGYRDALQAFDARLPELMDALGENDLLLLTADHGNDPTTPSTDHSREDVPVLGFHKSMKPGESRELGTRESFADLGQTIAQNFGLKTPAGTSFLSNIS